MESEKEVQYDTVVDSEGLPNEVRMNAKDQQDLDRLCLQRNQLLSLISKYREKINTPTPAESDEISHKLHDFQMDSLRRYEKEYSACMEAIEQFKKTNLLSTQPDS